MLTIRKEQFQEFKQNALKSFEQEMLIHLKNYAPELFHIRGKCCFLEVIMAGIRRAEYYKFSNCGPTRLYIESMFTLGFDFDTDPQFPWAATILKKTDKTHQMIIADQLYRAIHKYLNECMGYNNEHMILALKKFNCSDQLFNEISSIYYTESLLALLNHLYPEKFDYVGKKQLTILIHEGNRIAEQYCILNAQEKALFVVLMYAFGYGILNDPLYPWIKNVFENKQIKQSAGRMNRLYNKTKLYVKEIMNNL